MTQQPVESRFRDAYLRLRDAIITGELRPNERLVESELAERLHVSRTPVREGLQRLAAEGLVDNRRRGWVVLEHDDTTIREIYEVRAALEGFAARLAAQRGSAAQIQTIVEISRLRPRDFVEPPRSRLVEHNQVFHEAVIEAAGNTRLAETIRRTREYYFNQRIAAVYTGDEVVTALRGHQRVAQAIKRRDGELAEQLSRAHVFEALDLALHKLS